MSNAACLVANNHSRPAGCDVGYDPESDLIAMAPMAVPVCWLALFEASGVVTFEREDDDEVVVPSLVARLPEARGRLLRRRDIVLGHFPEFRPTWDRFSECLDVLKDRYIKVDLEELWDLEPDDFSLQIEAALRWFDSGDPEDFDQLLEMASIQGYDAEKRTYPAIDAGVPRAFHMRGYACAKASWDDDSDL